MDTDFFRKYADLIAETENQDGPYEIGEPKPGDRLIDKGNGYKWRLRNMNQPVIEPDYLNDLKNRRAWNQQWLNNMEPIDRNSPHHSQWSDAPMSGSASDRPRQNIQARINSINYYIREIERKMQK